MLQLTEQNLKDIQNKIGRSLVGEILQQIDVINTQPLSKEESLIILKSLIKNKVYEGLRQHTSLITQFSNGVNFVIDFIKPTKA